ncbi:putative ankyrin repeat protein MM_0045 [Aspergillus udagawae]|nr:putative ankyrin repeat protein MM_0045 [Aspergillus udagawae]
MPGRSVVLLLDIFQEPTRKKTLSGGLQVWYRKAPAAACSSGGTTANPASQLQLEYTPAQVLQDKVFLSALLTVAADVSVTLGGATVPATWIKTPENDIGIHHGEASFSGHSGDVVMTIHREGTVIAKVTGASISDSCTDGIQNYSAWVGSASSSAAVSASPGLKLDDVVCVNGTSVNSFVGLCEFACHYGYCPYSACTYESLGAERKKPNATNIQGYPITGEDATYSGLYSFRCNCPENTFGTEEVKLTMPTVSDFAAPACVAGTGDGDLAGLCLYACNFGYCPINSCTYTATGALDVPQAPTAGLRSKGAKGKDPLVYNGLCNFACSRGDYCPNPCISKDSSDDGNGGSSGDGSHGGGSGDVVYVGPLLWTDDDHDALCGPPCTLILPEYPVSPTSTVTWGPITVPLISQGDNDAVVTPKPFPLGYHATSLPITLPRGVELMPTDSSFTWTTGPSPSITVGPASTFSPPPPEPSSTPNPPIPKITVKPGKPHNSEGCGPGSTKPGCEINLCAILGPCPGSSGGSSGGGGSHGHSNDDDDEEPNSCCTTQTASICTEVISSYMPAGAATMTTTTKSYCVATAGCLPTGSTETITKTTSEEIHPMTVTAVDVFATAEPDSVLKSIASSISSRQKADFATEWAPKTTSSDSRPAPTSGSSPGKVEITYYKDDGKKSAPDAVITDGAYNGMKDGMSFTIFGTKCTYKDTSGGFALWGKDLREGKSALESFGDFSALIWAAKHGKPDPCNRLLQEGANPNTQDPQHRTPLSWAAGNGHKEVSSILLCSEKTDPNAPDAHLRTPLVWAAGKGLPSAFAACNSPRATTDAVHSKAGDYLAIVKLLLSTKDIQPDCRTERGETPLMVAAAAGAEDVVKELLRTGKVDANSMDKFGQTPLMASARNGHLGIVKRLLAIEGVDADARSQNGDSPLLAAARNGHAGIVKLLLAIPTVDPDQQPSFGERALLTAVAAGHTDVVEALLANEKVDPSLPNKYGVTALVRAAQHGRTHIMRLLLANGVEPDGEGQEG